MSRLLLPDLPEITSDNFEQSLSDGLFSEFFNEFLLQPVFGVPLRYDGMSAGFELLSEAAVRLSCRIRAALQQIQARTLPAEPVRDNRYTVSRLDPDQTVRWLKTHRLSFFLQSACYFEFRLAKCLSQLGGSSSDRLQCAECRNTNSSRSSPQTAELNTADASLQTDRSCFQDFKRSLLGGPGENILHLWMDIERLKTLGAKSKSRYLLWMKAQYTWSSSEAALNEQLLLKLGLNSTVCWQEEKLHDVQPQLTEILLLYWGQRFHLFPSAQWQVCECVLSSSASEIFTRSVCADTDMTGKVELDHSKSHTLMEVLHTESRSGFFFTHFCQNSGQQLWENATCFCTELLQYHHLFSQSTFDPYRAKRTAQLLYASYLSSGAQMSVGLNEESRRSVLTRLSPAFEDLFDQAEEHALNILLEPWTQLMQTLTDTLNTVAVWQEVRYAEPELFQTLQTLYTHTRSRMLQERSPPPTPAEGSRAPDLWAKVPQEFRTFHLDSLLQNHIELQFFMSFLEENSASLVLQCWLDVEQLKKSHGALLEERSINFKDKYLNSNFLFGAGSLATEEQQMRLLQLCGGLQGLQLISQSALAELQSLLHSCLETHWLPLFLCSPKFIQRHQRQVAGVCEQQPVVHQRRKRHQLKASAGVMSCSQESVCLRRALLNPVTRLQFQKFLSVVVDDDDDDDDDDLLENDLLFWLEVQRYKDLCHSLCDDVTLQRKVSIIISRFFQSSVPPARQIHVPPEAAQRVMSLQRTLGPYIFRETQACVFKELLKHWPNFSTLRSSVGEDALLRELEQMQRDRRRSRQTDQQDNSRSQVEEEADDEEHNSGTEDGRGTFKICWSFWRQMKETKSLTTPPPPPSSPH